MVARSIGWSMSPTQNMPAEAADFLIPTASKGFAVCVAVLLTGSGFFDVARAQQTGSGAFQKAETMKIRIAVEGRIAMATLDGTPLAKHSPRCFHCL